MRRAWYWPKGWWCPKHPWPPAWARTPYYYPADLTGELKALQNYKKELEAELAELTKRIEELKKLTEEKK
ncbi:MAG: DUF5320 domain-containing protein [Candidatus Bathyarchaeia archaeon]